MKLYYNKMSGPCRATLLTVKALGIDVELITINLAEKEQLSFEFLKMNPLHTVPTLEDDGSYIWDSHAINCYLVDKYGKTDDLYPKDLLKRAIVNQRLHFNSNVLLPRWSIISKSIKFAGAKSVPKERADHLTQAYTDLETLLEQGNKYVCGNELTIADFSIVATITSANTLVPLATNRFPLTMEWLARMEKLDYYQESNQEGLQIYASMLKNKMNK